MAQPVATYEENMARLETIVSRLSEKEVSLEEALDLYAQAATLISAEEKLLHNAQLQMTTITEALQHSEQQGEKQ